jgi:hypothetical protein
MCQSHYLVRSPKTGHFVRMNSDGDLILSIDKFDLFCEHTAPQVCSEARHKFLRRFVVEEIPKQASSSVKTQVH